MCLICSKECESCEMTKTFARSAWLRHIDSGERYYELLSLEAQDAMINPRQSPGQAFDVEKT